MNLGYPNVTITLIEGSRGGWYIHYDTSENVSWGWDWPTAIAVMEIDLRGVFPWDDLHDEVVDFHRKHNI